MERLIMQDLIAWKNREDRKPLILLGARQVGKTYILKEFGQREFENVAYINCDNNAMARDLFASDYHIDRILLTIGAITGVNIEAGKTLIIMDEIQELHRGLASLKYFCENAREYHVAVACSLLGLSLHQGESYPVGKVNTLEMYPMTFEEYLWARGFKQRIDLLQHGMWDVVKSLRTLYIQHLREYYLVGGMPEAVYKFIETHDANAVREVQEEMIRAYEKDISKHAPKEQVVKISQVWNSIPSQLAKEKKKVHLWYCKTRCQSQGLCVGHSGRNAGHTGRSEGRGESSVKVFESQHMNQIPVAYLTPILTYSHCFKT